MRASQNRISSSPHGKIKATIAEEEVVFINGDQRLAIPLQNITALTYGTDIRHRSLLRFVPFLDLDKAHYVAVTWIGNRCWQETAGDFVVLRGKGSKYYSALRQAAAPAVTVDGFLFALLFSSTTSEGERKWNF